MGTFGPDEAIVGVHSFLISVDGTVNADYGEAMGSTRVAPYADWITSHAQGATTNPEPGTAAMVLFFGAGALLRRR